MATIPQIQRGLTLFIDNDLACSFTGWQKAIIAGVGGLVASNIPALMKTYGTHPFVTAIGLYDPESNTVNIDALYNAIVPKLASEKIPVTIPQIGTIKIGKEEIDTLFRYIKEV